MTLYPWQIQTYEQLIEAFLNGYGHHALLFKTDEGLGTHHLIMAFAGWLFCEQKINQEACKKCKSCQLWASGNHPDFHLIESIENKDIGIEQIRDLTTKLQRFAQQGGNSVVYIRNAERLTEAAANALLKTLEEPHDNIYFLLEASLQSSLLATIQSRCQVWLLNAPHQNDALAWLQQEFPEQNLDNLNTALRINHYRPLFCKNFLENDRLQQRKAFLQNFWRFFKSRDVWLLFAEFSKEKDEILQQLEWIETFISDSLKAQLGIMTNWVNADLQNGIIPFSQSISAIKLLRGVQLLQNAGKDIREINAVNLELILLDCLTKLVSEIFE